MKNLLTNLFKSVASDGILEKPGDRAEAKITKTYRKVLKVSKEQGKLKYSKTQYPNGTTVETKTVKK